MSLHLPFDDMHRQIRLLRPKRELSNSLLQLEISNFTLDDPNIPQWRAVSYMWGDAEATESIYLNGSRFQVRPNLHALLEQLWEKSAEVPEYDVHYFVDAICIDQSSLTERAAQVTLMAQIYEKAEAVIMWLGNPEVHQTKDVQKLFRNCSMFLKEYMHWGNEHGISKDRWEERLGYSTSSCGPNWDFLEDIFTRPYWNRAWVRQEILLARKIRLLYGPHEVTGDVILALINWCHGSILPVLVARRVKESTVSQLWEHRRS